MYMSLPSVSIIIPTYNEELFLPGCLESISNLDYPKDKVEVIVVDNGSIDRTLDIAKAAGVKLLINPDLNVAGLRNFGAKNSQNDILAFVDADCLVDKDWLKNAAEYVSDERVVIWGSPPVPPEKCTWVQEAWFLVRKKVENIQTVEWLETMNLFIRKKDFMAVAGFNQDLETCEDVDFCYRAAQNRRIVSDCRIKVIHLGEAATVKHFFQKELWRGKSNLRGLLSHGIKLKEMPSLILPLYFLIIVPVTLLYFMMTWSITSFLFMILIMMTPSMGMIFKLYPKKIQNEQWLKLLLLIHIYFFARSISLLKKRKN